jgi:hypothetical protein
LKQFGRSRAGVHTIVRDLPKGRYNGPSKSQQVWKSGCLGKDEIKAGAPLCWGQTIPNTQRKMAALILHSDWVGDCGKGRALKTTEESHSPPNSKTTCQADKHLRVSRQPMNLAHYSTLCATDLQLIKWAHRGLTSQGVKRWKANDVKAFTRLAQGRDCHCDCSWPLSHFGLAWTRYRLVARKSWTAATQQTIF